ncbi:MAG: aminoglycoside phosphotransferase family protein [Clostridia bacterium]|nr:aminoglycoside phosphotransferase family protein [Clostridia bacterium]
MYEDVLRYVYNIDTYKVQQIQGGWSACAYKVQGNDKKEYFLKVYDKIRPSTQNMYTSLHISSRVLRWLNSYSSLTNDIVELINTLDNQCIYEDEKNIYILYKYIHGKTPRDEKISNTHFNILSNIIAKLHTYGSEIPFDLTVITEDFNIPFYDNLLNFVTKEYSSCSKDLKEVLSEHLNTIIHQLQRLMAIQKNIVKENIDYRLCHTDIHKGNIIIDDSVHLLDFDNLLLAPVEADLFAFYQQPRWERLLSLYKKTHPHYKVNEQLMKFYNLRRVLIDIWEEIELLESDAHNVDRITSLNNLRQQFI